MSRELRLLEHLSYVMECVLQNYLGEAKHELGGLIDTLRNEQGIPDAMQLA